MPHAARRHRDTAKPPAEWDQRGEEVFRAVYRDAAEGVQKMLYDAYPDLGPSAAHSVFCSILCFYVCGDAIVRCDSSKVFKVR